MKTESTIDVYSVPLNCGSKDLSTHYELLSNDEKQRASRFKFDRHRDSWVSSRAALRLILAKFTETAPGDLIFAIRSDGKPEIHGTRTPETTADEKDPTGRQERPAIFFNLSHSGDQALVAISREEEVGCDVEQVKRIRDWQAVTRRFFSPKEQEELEGVGRAQKTLAFYLGWTRKEAVIKTTGEGLRADLTSFDVSLTPGRKAKVYADRHARPSDLPWHLIHIDAENGYAGAVALRASRAPNVRLHSGWRAIDR